MKRAAVLGLAIVSAAGAAWSQAAAPTKADGPVITRPKWLRTPTAPELTAVFPAEAWRKGVSGRATISCNVSVEGTLARCTVVSEDPPGSGFGFAALSLAPTFRMQPQTVNGRPVSGGTVRVPIVFRIEGGSPSPSRSAPSREAGAAYVTRPIWVEAPTRGQLAAVYPADLKANGGTASALLQCELRPDGRTTGCTVVTEDPVRSGAGRAALGLARTWRAEPPRDASGAPVRNALVRIPVQFSPSVLAAGGQQIARPEWGRLPEATQVASLFPAKAKAAGVTKGDVLLNCTVKAGGGVTGCTVGRETPAGMGFGEAALALAPSFTMSAWTSDGRPVDGARVRIPIRYEP